jgi:hypothetical protein
MKDKSPDRLSRFYRIVEARKHCSNQVLYRILKGIPISPVLLARQAALLSAYRDVMIGA